MVTLETATEFLLQAGLIDNHAIIDGDLVITSTTRRNRNLQITFARGGFLLKQPHDNAHESADSLRREARFYRFCTEEGLLADLMPALVHANESEGLLLVELIRNATPLWRYYRLLGAEHFPEPTAAALGTRLAELHQHMRLVRPVIARTRDFLDDVPPFAFTLHRPHPRVLSGLSGGAYAYIHVLQQDTETCARIDATRSAWTAEAIIHGDIKMDNVLVIAPEDVAAAGPGRLRIVDWEMAQWGDPAWDVGSVFQDFVVWWVVSMPQHEDHARAAMSSSFPIDNLRAGASAFWNAYAGSQDAAAMDSLLLRAIDHAGCRMIQTGYEIASRFDDIPGPARMLLQAGANLLREPMRGIAQFFQLREEHADAA